MSLRLLSCFLFVAVAHAAAPAPPPLPTKSDFVGTKWEGFWYELYSLPQSDETMCTCTASNFTMLPSPDQWQDLNHCKRFGSMEKVPLKMYQLDRRYPERLAIGMAPWLTFTKMWIIDTDYENYSLVGDPSRKALWIYGRKPGVAHGVYANLTSRASDLGFDISKLKMTDQDNHCEYDTGALEATVQATATPLELHLVGGNHCEDIAVDFSKESSLDTVKEWWSGNKYKYTLYQKGLCPKPYTHVDHIESPIGVHGVVTREMGEGSSQVQPLELAEAPLPKLDCSFNDTSTLTIALSHPDAGNIKIRTCRTGLGCTGAKGHWNAFKDCPYYMGPKQTVQLKFEQKVAYFAFYNTKTEQTEEFWKPKDKPWPTSYTMQQV